MKYTFLATAACVACSGFVGVTPASAQEASLIDTSRETDDQWWESSESAPAGRSQVFDGGHFSVEERVEPRDVETEFGEDRYETYEPAWDRPQQEARVDRSFDSDYQNERDVPFEGETRPIGGDSPYVGDSRTQNPGYGYDVLTDADEFESWYSPEPQVQRVYDSFRL